NSTLLTVPSTSLADAAIWIVVVVVGVLITPASGFVRLTLGGAFGPGGGAGRTSIRLTFQRSVVGAVQSIVTAVPAVGVGLVCDCPQKVSPVEARYSPTLVWLGPTVRAIARSQSLPTAQTHDPAAVVVKVAVGTPVAALPPPVAPSTAVFAPLKATITI